MSQQFHPQQHTLNLRGRLLSLSHPLVMGILNVTPDSFYTGSRVLEVQSAINKAGEMLDEGADMIDIGAVSSRPGAEILSVAEEERRLLPVLEGVIGAYPQALISIDTWREEVARRALTAGAHMINDISGGTLEPEIVRHCADAGAPFVLMHMRGRPGAMPSSPVYDDVCSEVLGFFAQRIRELQELGIHDIILDPGFGFGKTVEHNFEMLRRLDVFRFLHRPLLVGISRKSMIWRTLDTHPGDALNGTSALHMYALERGANILRVHDVRSAREVITLWQAMQDKQGE